jgi:hypothetical protein
VGPHSGNEGQGSSLKLPPAILPSADAEVIWSHAPEKTYMRIDLLTIPARRFGRYTAQLLNPAVEIGFVAACNPRLKLPVVYALRRDFRWVVNREERYNRTSAPWRGKTSCRGLEFSRTRFAVGDAKPSRQGRFLENQVSLAAGEIEGLGSVTDFVVRGAGEPSRRSKSICCPSKKSTSSGTRGRKLSVAADRFRARTFASGKHHEFACHRYRFEQMQSGGIFRHGPDSGPANLRLHSGISRSFASRDKSRALLAGGVSLYAIYLQES